VHVAVRVLRVVLVLVPKGAKGCEPFVHSLGYSHFIKCLATRNDTPRLGLVCKGEYYSMYSCHFESFHSVSVNV